MIRILLALALLVPGVAWADAFSSVAPPQPPNNVAITGGTISGADVSGAKTTATGGTTARTLGDWFNLLPPPVTRRAPLPSDDAGYAIGALWNAPSGMFTKVASNPARWVLAQSLAAPGDAVSANGAPLACYGTKSMNAAYGANPAIDIKTSSAGATTTINFLSDGTIDKARLFSVLAANGGVARVVQVYDTSGNARHATQAYATAPAITMFNDINGTPSLVFDTVIDPSPSVYRILSIPSSVTTTSQAFSWMGMLRVGVASRTVAVLQMADTSAPTYPLEFGFQASGLTGGTAGYWTNFGGAQTAGGLGSLTPTVIGASMSGSAQTFVYGAGTGSAAAAPLQTLAGGTIGQTTGVAAGSVMELAGMCIYGRALSAADMATEQAAFHSTFATAPQVLSTVTFDGDSIEQGYQSSYNRSTSRLNANNFVVPVLTYNAGWWGEFESQRITALSYTVQNYNPSAPVNIYVEEAGINDLLQNQVSTVSQVQAMDQTFCTTIHALGTNAKAMVETILPSAALTAPQATLRTAVNAMRVANAGACKFDGVIDAANDPTIGISPAQPGTYYNDTTHPNDAGYAIKAQLEIDAVNRLLRN